MAHCPAYSGRDLLAVLLAGDPLPRLLQAAGAHFEPASRLVRRRRCRTRIVRLLNTHVGRYLGVLLLFVGVIGAVLSLVYFLISLDIGRPAGRPGVDAVDGVLHPHHHRRRGGVAVRSGAGKPPRRRGGNAPPDRAADERNRGAQAHRRQAAEGQGSRRSGEQGQEPLRRRPQPRIAHAAQRHPRLRPAARARPGDPAAADQRDQGRAAQRRASVRPDRRTARHLKDRGRAAFTSAATRCSYADFLDQIVAMFRLQATAKGIEFRHRPDSGVCRPWCKPTKTGCARS